MTILKSEEGLVVDAPARQTMNDIITGEILGVPVDLEVSSKREGDNIVFTVSGYMPKMEWDAERGVMKVWPPPRLPKPPTKEERMLALLCEFGFDHETPV